MAISGNTRDSGPAYGFQKADCERIAATVKREEKAYRNPPPGRGRYAGYLPTGPFPAKATTAFTAGSPTSPSSATITLYVPASSGHGWVLATGTGSTFTAYNPYTSAIAINSLVWVVISNGTYYVLAANC